MSFIGVPRRRAVSLARWFGPGAMSTLTAGFAAGILACTTAVDPPAVAVVTLFPSVDSLESGSQATLFSPTTQDANGTELTGRRITWASSNTTVATVDSEGRIQGLSVGQSTITATSEGKSATALVRVILPVAQVVVTPDSVDVPMTTSHPLNVQVLGPSGEAIVGRSVTWASANPSVATVNAGGVVFAVSQGQTFVSASAGTKMAQSKVIVGPEPVTLVQISPPAPVIILRLTQTIQLGATCHNGTGAELPGRTITWTTANPGVASVSSSGLVTALTVGQAVITAECGGRRASVTIQVTPIPVSSVAISPTQVTVLVGQQYQMQATARDSAGNVLSLQGRQTLWTSQNLPVATVSAVGVVQGVSEGVSNVSVSVDGVSSSDAAVTVQRVPVASVQITPNPGQVQVNSVLQLTVTLRDVNGNVLTGRQVTWRSLNESVATVSQTGIVNGIAVGMVTIQAESEGITGTAVITVNP